MVGKWTMVDGQWVEWMDYGQMVTDGGWTVDSQGTKRGLAEQMVDRRLTDGFNCMHSLLLS